MFRDANLPEVFQRVADEADWREFCEIKVEGDVDTWLWIFALRDSSSQSCSRERAILRYRELWINFAGLLREKLLSGEWVAHGFNPQFGPHPVRIDKSHWSVLEFALGHDRAEGQGYVFTNLSFTAVKAASTTMPHVERASLLRELVRWIEALAASESGPMTAHEVRELARARFAGTKISDYLFGDAWRASEKPAHFLQKGRPKAKVASF